MLNAHELIFIPILGGKKIVLRNRTGVATPQPPPPLVAPLIKLEQSCVSLRESLSGVFPGRRYRLSRHPLELMLSDWSEGDNSFGVMCF